MRHFLLLALTITPLTGCMGKAPTRAVLITTTCATNRFGAGYLCTTRATVHITPVTVAANSNLTVTAGTVEKAGTRLHRPFAPRRTRLDSRTERYLLSGRAWHGCGHGTGRRLWRSLAGAVSVLNGTDGLPDCAPFVIFSRPQDLVPPENLPPISLFYGDGLNSDRCER